MTSLKRNRLIIGITIICSVMLIAMLAASLHSDALSGLEASGYVNCNSGAFLRSSTSTSSSKLAGLKKGSPVVIHKEVFTHKKKTGKTYRWYYVTTGAGDGYMRSDVITVSRYGSAAGKTTKKIKYRAGAGSKMKKKGTIKKKKDFTIVMEAKAKGSSKRWYKIRKGSKYYYVSSSGTKISNIKSGLSTANINTAAATVTQSAQALAVVNGMQMTTGSTMVKSRHPSIMAVITAKRRSFLEEGLRQAYWITSSRTAAIRSYTQLSLTEEMKRRCSKCVREEAPTASISDMVMMLRRSSPSWAFLTENTLRRVMSSAGAIMWFSIWAEERSQKLQAATTTSGTAQSGTIQSESALCQTPNTPRPTEYTDTPETCSKQQPLHK